MARGSMADALVGRVLDGRYQIVGRLGGGGMGEVFEAEHRLLGRRVAIKVLHPELSEDADLLKRFMNEARAAATLGHPNILECTDVGVTPEGMAYLVLELLVGRELSDVIAEGPLEFPRAVAVARQVASALGAAHARGIVHRDLKPENVFLTTRDGRPDHVKVLDFGIGKFTGTFAGLTNEGAVLGSPFYMSPEQLLDSSSVDARTDVYSLGVMLYQMVSGRLPFEAPNFAALILAVRTTEPPSLALLRPDLPPAFAALVHQALAKDPARRFASMSAIDSALAKIPTRRRDRSPIAFAATHQAPSSPAHQGPAHQGPAHQGPAHQSPARPTPRPAASALTPAPAPTPTPAPTPEPPLAATVLMSAEPDAEVDYKLPTKTGLRATGLFLLLSVAALAGAGYHYRAPLMARFAPPEDARPTAEVPNEPPTTEPTGAATPTPPATPAVEGAEAQRPPDTMESLLAAAMGDGDADRTDTIPLAQRWGEIVRAMRPADRRALQSCYDRALRAVGGGREARSIISVAFEPPREVTVSVTGEDFGGLNACLADRVRQWDFSEAEGTRGRFQFAVRFHPSGTQPTGSSGP